MNSENTQRNVNLLNNATGHFLAFLFLYKEIYVLNSAKILANKFCSIWVNYFYKMWFLFHINTKTILHR